MNLHFLLAGLFALQPFSFATSLYLPTFSELTKNSAHIARGTLTNIHATNEVTSDGMKAIYTYANLEVKEVLKGNFKKSNIVIKKVGGTVDGYTVDIPSSPEFTEGEDTLLFLSEEKPDQSFEVNNLELGKFELEEKNGELVLKGGLFNYGTGESHEEVLPNSKDLSENKKTWTLTALKNLIAGQDSENTAGTRPGSPVNTQSVAATASSDTKTLPTTTAESSKDPSEPKTSSSTLWAGLGLALLSLALFFKFRKKA